MVHPLLYEINTRCWLRGLSERQGVPVTLASVPAEEFAAWRRLGFTHIWLMGVWTTGPRARAQALANRDLRRSYAETLPDWTEEDVAGSPYAIADYHVPSPLGGDEGLAEFRARLHSKGLKLVLDFVPNHLGLDHPWIVERPQVFVQSPKPAPGTFRQETKEGVRWLAHGKDPYFAPWTDTVQLDYRTDEARTAMLELLQSIADRCDGVRCDMAMLLLNDVFAKTWERFPVPTTNPANEFWSDATAAVKKRNREFLFLAEAYWGTEQRLQALGFDYAYDKELYDKLVAHDAAGAQKHLLTTPGELLGLGAHFLENHDEPRIASRLSFPEHQAAALVVIGLPGMRFLHEGQLSGAQLWSPVQLARRTQEPVQVEIERMYDKLLTCLRATSVGQGEVEVLQPQAAWPENPTAQNFILIQWRGEGQKFDLLVANLAGHRGQCYARVSGAELSRHDWTVKDLLGAEQFVRDGKELESKGLYLDLPGHGAQLFQFEAV